MTHQETNHTEASSSPTPPAPATALTLSADLYKCGVTLQPGEVLLFQQNGLLFEKEPYLHFQRACLVALTSNRLLLLCYRLLRRNLLLELHLSSIQHVQASKSSLFRAGQMMLEVTNTIHTPLTFSIASALTGYGLTSNKNTLAFLAALAPLLPEGAITLPPSLSNYDTYGAYWGIALALACIHYRLFGNHPILALTFPILGYYIGKNLNQKPPK